MKIIAYLAKLCAIQAGLMLTVITLMTCASLIGHNTMGGAALAEPENLRGLQAAMN